MQYLFCMLPLFSTTTKHDRIGPVLQYPSGANWSKKSNAVQNEPTKNPSDETGINMLNRATQLSEIGDAAAVIEKPVCDWPTCCAAIMLRMLAVAALPPSRFRWPGNTRTVRTSYARRRSTMTPAHSHAIRVRYLIAVAPVRKLSCAE